jgi:hypothetical protein
VRDANPRIPELPKAPDWSQGRCATHPDPDLWTSSDPAERQAAVFICHRCPIEAACRQYGMSITDQWDNAIYGGLPAQERRRQRRSMLARIAADLRG